MKTKIDSAESRRPFPRQAAVFLCLAAAMTFVASNSVQASLPEFTANAYGTYAFIGSTVTVGKTAPCGIGSACGTPQVGATAKATVLSVNAAPIVTTGAINTSASSSSDAATATSDVHQVSLLGGLITADEVKAVSTTSHDALGFHTSGAGSNFLDFVIHQSPATIILSGTPAPNTTIQLKLGGSVIGKVVLNEQIASSSATNAQLTVNMIHVYLTADVTINGVKIKSGTQIIVSHAFSGLLLVNGPASLDGTSFGTEISSTTIKSSPTVPASVSCLGNALITNTQVGINVPNVLSSGTITDTAQGSVTASLSSSETTSTVQNVNLLNGVVTASVVHADAKGTTTDGTTFNFSEGGGSSFTSLVVNGVAFVNVGANTKITLKDIATGKTIGTLYLHRVIKNTNSITVRMIELVIASGNPLNLPAGMDIIVASASASLHSPAHP